VAPVDARKGAGLNNGVRMAEEPRSELVSDLQDYTDPPVAEVALGVQFRPLYGLRAIDLADLRERWRAEYPLIQEQPYQAPVVEAAGVAQTSVQFVLGPQTTWRLWFLSEDQSALVQLQHDRLGFNWRKPNVGDKAYPRYDYVRAGFERRWADMADFVAEHKLGPLEITQVEVNYVNAIDFGPDNLGELERLLRVWRGTPQHHLGNPEQARLMMVFRVPGVGRDPVRMYVQADPAQLPDGTPGLFLTITVRGAAPDGSVQRALDFMDRAHPHIVTSFDELTTDAMHALWGRKS